MSFRQMLLSGAARFVRAPSDDYGAEDYVDDGPDDEAPIDDTEDDGPLEDDEAEPAELADDEDEGEAPPPRRQPTRGQAAIIEARRRAQAAEERAIRAEAAAQQAAAHIQQQTQGATAQQRAQYLEQLDPDQRTEFLLREQGQQVGAAFQALEFRLADSTDKSAFEALCARNPTAAKMKDKVETELANLRRQGMNVAREIILEREIGRMALARAPQAKGRAEKKAAENRQRQTASPGRARGDVAGSGRALSDKAARNKRLENMKI